jgi:hypothetical protein
MSDPMENKDRDEKHRRRRGLDEGEDDLDGRAVAAALYRGENDVLRDEVDSDDSDEVTLFD